MNRGGIMNCNDCQNVLQQHDFSQRLPLPVSAHLRMCSECASQAKDFQLKIGFDGLSHVPPISLDFNQRLSQKLADAELDGQSELTASSASSINWLSYAAVAGAFMLFGMLLQPNIQRISQPAQSVYQAVTKVEVLTQRQQVVNILLNSRKEYAQAELSISVSGALRFEEQDSIQTVAWSTPLKQGRNILPLPVYLLNNSGGQITINMKAESGFKQVTIDVAALKAATAQETFL